MRRLASGIFLLAAIVTALAVADVVYRLDQQLRHLELFPTDA